MKKIISLFLVLVMIISVVALLASCDDKKQPEQTTTAEETTTTTAEETTTTTTTTTTETTTEETTTTTTTTESTTTTTTGAPIFARFDFGTKTYAEDNGLTSNEYLMAQLDYDKTRLEIEFKEDSWLIKTKRGYNSTLDGKDPKTEFSVQFNDLVQFDFDDDIKTGNSPNHRYVKFRLIHSSTNNMMSIYFRSTSDGGWYTNTVASNMYIVEDGKYTKTSTAAKSDKWIVRTYDMSLCASMTSGKFAEGVSKTSTFKQQVAAIEKANGSVPGNNWAWGGGKQMLGLRFFFFNGLSLMSVSDCDTRTLIDSGAYVDVDYVVFGSSVEQLEGYHSYLELAQ
ncbi:MAG: hypothetical protein IJR55_06265 [Clostridia bacterium]|nr:hypothetical protein [Clostridia bacterium]